MPVRFLKYYHYDILVNIEDIAGKCMSNLDLSSESKAVRQFLQCVVSNLGAKYIVVDNGLKYDYLVYVEVSSKEDVKKIADLILTALDRLARSLTGSISDYVSKRKVLDWGTEIYLLLSKEFVVVKYVIK